MSIIRKKNSEIADNWSAITAIGTRKHKETSHGYRILLALKLLRPYVEAINEAKQEILSRFAEKDGDGKPAMRAVDGPGGGIGLEYDVQGDNKRLAAIEIQKLDRQEVELDLRIQKIDYDEINTEANPLEASLAFDADLLIEFVERDGKTEAKAAE